MTDAGTPRPQAGPEAATPEPRGGNGTHALDLPQVAGHPTVTRLVYEAIRERIVFGELAPGTRLVEADLAARFGVSKTPVREALLSLAAAGLISLRAHRGAEVSRLSPEEYRDLQYARDALEFGALPEVVRAITPEALAEAEAHLAEMERAHRERDYRRYRRAQRLLHRVLLRVPGSPTVTELALNLNDRMDRYGHVLVANRPDWWAAELEISRERLERIRRGDVEGLIALIRDWHRRTIEDVERRFSAGTAGPAYETGPRDSHEPPAAPQGRGAAESAAAGDA